ncbi:MAG: hypothetical protein FJ363_08700 [Gemmatimonadetes bacterium]|nr:hypothetical protein [Gemmatimonadota bacterium]
MVVLTLNRRPLFPTMMLLRLLMIPALLGSAALSAAAQSSSAPAVAAPKAADSGSKAPRKRAPAKPKPAKAAPVTSEAKLDSIYDLRWPVKGPDPLPGSILPNKRIIAYYGNPLSRRMGVLGEYEPNQMLAMLDAEVRAWTQADPGTPVQPALHLIAVVAQAGPGSDGMYRARMPDTLVERVAAWAAKRNALVFLDVQVGRSTLQQELPRLEKFLSRPNFHLGIDPEFSMKKGGVPGKRIGTFDAEDINYASRFLQELVTRHQIPPKVFVIHRFTKNGVTNSAKIALDPRVQVVMHMDGFGPPRLKKATFRSWIKAEPVQFVGWKQFYKPRNDNPRTTIAEILRLNPRPLYVQYQ